MTRRARSPAGAKRSGAAARLDRRGTMGRPAAGKRGQALATHRFYHPALPAHNLCGVKFVLAMTVVKEIFNILRNVEQATKFRSVLREQVERTEYGVMDINRYRRGR